MNSTLQPNHTITTREQWLVERTELLEEEKRLTRQMDALSAKRRALPWVKVEKEYTFRNSMGRVAWSDLFSGKSQLVIQHFMLGPGCKEGCTSCSYMADHPPLHRCLGGGRNATPATHQNSLNISSPQYSQTSKDSKHD